MLLNGRVHNRRNAILVVYLVFLHAWAVGFLSRCTLILPPSFSVWVRYLAPPVAISANLGAPLRKDASAGDVFLFPPSFLMIRG